MGCVGVDVVTLLGKIQNGTACSFIHIHSGIHNLPFLPSVLFCSVRLTFRGESEVVPGGCFGTRSRNLLQCLAGGGGQHEP